MCREAVCCVLCCQKSHTLTEEGACSPLVSANMAAGNVICGNATNHFKPKTREHTDLVVRLEIMFKDEFVWSRREVLSR